MEEKRYAKNDIMKTCSRQSIGIQ